MNKHEENSDISQPLLFNIIDKLRDGPVTTGKIGLHCVVEITELQSVIELALHWDHFLDRDALIFTETFELF